MSKFRPKILRYSLLSLLLFQLCSSPIQFAYPAGEPMQGAGAIRVLELQVFGNAFDQESLETRISRLEYAFQQPAMPGVNLSYRMERLVSAYQAQYFQTRSIDAINAYNQGIDAASQNRVERALECYKHALFLDPHLIVAYNNLGNLLERLNRYPEAIKVYLQALKALPKTNTGGKNDDLALLHRNLGVLYEKNLKIDEALTHYQEYLKMATQPDAKIATIVRQYHYHQEIEGKSTDYVVSARTAVHGRSLLWDIKINPIPVFVELDSDQVVFLPAVSQALRAWEKASHLRLLFKEVGTAAQALIRIRFQEGPLSHPYLDVGRAQYDADEKPGNDGETTYQKIQITINTGERDLPISLEARLSQVKRLALHELGHAVGIWGHSPDPGDIMYSRPMAQEISSRDARTIERLYNE